MVTGSFVRSLDETPGPQNPTIGKAADEPRRHQVGVIDVAVLMEPRPTFELPGHHHLRSNERATVWRW
jgi:hypothetical protein